MEMLQVPRAIAHTQGSPTSIPSLRCSRDSHQATGRARLGCLGSIEEAKSSIKSQSAFGKQRKRLLRINFSLPKLYGDFWKCQAATLQYFLNEKLERWLQTPLFGLSGNLYPNISIKNFCWLICLGFCSGERDGGLGGFAYFPISVILMLHKLLQG